MYNINVITTKLINIYLMSIYNRYWFDNIDSLAHIINKSKIVLERRT